jgi:hypothetical protein
LNGTHELLAYTDDVNVLRNNIDTTKDTDTLNVASKENGSGRGETCISYCWESQTETTGKTKTWVGG